MKKKIFILPLAISAMAITSCNGRHTFNKKLTYDEFQNAYQAISSAQIKDDLLTSTSVLGSGKLIIKLDNTEKADNIIIGRHYQDDEHVFNYDKAKDSLYVKAKTKSLNSSTNRDTLYKNSKIIEDEKYYDIYQSDNIIGSKIKGLDKKGYSCDKSWNLIDFVNLIVSMRSDFWFYGVSNKYHSSDLCSDNKSSISYLDYVLSLCKIDASLETNLKFAKHDNDDKSLSFSFKATTSFKNYMDAFDVDNNKGLKCASADGTVDLDFFWGIEDNFLTQMEGKIKIHKGKYADLEFSKNCVVDHEAYFKMEFDYQHGSVPNINENEYAKI